MPAARSESHESRLGWLVSLLFWSCLLIAATCYALVALAPKLVTHFGIREDRYANQVRLVALERQVSYLERVVQALESDPAFAAQLARIDFDASRPGEERIAVGAELSLNAREVAASDHVDEVQSHWYAPALQRLANDTKLRRQLLVVAALLTVFSFTFLQESQSPQLEAAAGKVQSGAGWLARRYRKSA